MNKERFFSYIKEHVKERLPQEYQKAHVALDVVTKGNDTKHTCLIIRRAEEEAVPAIYLDQLFEQYQQGLGLDGALDRIAGLRMRYDAGEQMAGLGERLLDYGWCRPRLYAAVCSPELDRERLQGLVHTRQWGFEAYYRVHVGEQMELCVTPEIMKAWGATVEEIHRDALGSSLSRDVRLYLMEDVLGCAGQEGGPEDLMGLPEGQWNGKLPEESPMLVLTNARAEYGAAAILIPEALDRAAELIGGNYYILPSSVHEVILAPIMEMAGAEALKEMICEINEAVISEEERLSEEAYVYDWKGKEILRATDYEQRREQLKEALFDNKKQVRAGWDLMEEQGRKPEGAMGQILKGTAQESPRRGACGLDR